MAELFRCWLGHPLPATIQPAVRDAQMQIKKRAGSEAIRWYSSGEIALQLVSLGELANASVLRVQGIVQETVKRHSPFELELTGVGGSPNVTMPKSAWIGLAGELENLKALRSELAVTVQQFVQAVDDKPYEPVVEIGVLRRFDDRARTEMGRSIKMSNVGSLGRFTFSAVHVLASHATTAGPVVQSIAEVPLA